MCVAKLVYEAAKTYGLTRPDREEMVTFDPTRGKKGESGHRGRKIQRNYR